MITQAYLKTVLHYDKKTGIFTWIKVAPCHVKAGQRAGYMTNGYRLITINGYHYREHRLAFLYMTGSIPKLIDHKNTNRVDNRWDNLREATKVTNAANQNAHVDSQSGLKGVAWDKTRNQWRASIQCDKRWQFLGRFETKEAAAAAYNTKALEVFGEFAKINEIST